MRQYLRFKNHPVLKSDIVREEETSSIKFTVYLQSVTSYGIDQWSEGGGGPECVHPTNQATPPAAKRLDVR